MAELKNTRRTPKELRPISYIFDKYQERFKKVFGQTEKSISHQVSEAVFTAGLLDYGNRKKGVSLQPELVRGLDVIKEPLEAGIVGQDDFPNVGAAGKAMEPGEIEEPCVALFKAECSNLLDQFGTLQHGIPIGAGRAPAEANISGSIGRGNRPWKFIPRARTYSNEKVSSPADGLPGLFSGLILETSKGIKRRTAPAAITNRHGRVSSGSTLVNSPTWSANISPRTPEFPSSDFNELKEKGNDTRPRSPSERSGSDQSITYGEEDVSTDQEGEAGTETETAKLVAQAIATNNEDWEGTVRVIESNNSTELEELKETHADELKELRQEHQQKVQHLLRTHAVAQRTIAKKGERDIKVFQDQLKDLKKDKEAIEGKLLYLTTEVEALAAEIIGEKDRLELAANTALRIQAAQDEHKLHEADSMPVVAHTTSLPQKPVETSAPYESRTDSYSKGIFSNPKFPTAQRLLRVEAENARLRTDLAQRHEDVTFYVTQNQRLRLTMQADPVKEAYVDLQLFKLTDTVAELQERLVQYDTVLEREKRASEAESQRLLDRISVLSEEKRRSELDVQYHKEAKEEPWNQNSSLLSNLKDNFTKTNFDKAFLKHHELLLKEMKELEYKVNAYEFERKERIEEVNVLRQKIRALELDDCALKSKAKIHELEDRIKRMAIERDDRDSELGFFHSKAQAEKEAEENAKRDPNVELAVQELVLCARDDEIARLKIKLEAYNPVGNEQVEPTSFDDGFPGCIEESPRPEGSFGFF